jgi:hypothetical protein
VTGQAKSTVGMPHGMDNQDMRVFKGCMAPDAVIWRRQAIEQRIGE